MKERERERERERDVVDTGGIGALPTSTALAEGTRTCHKHAKHFRRSDSKIRYSLGRQLVAKVSFTV